MLRHYILSPKREYFETVYILNIRLPTNILQISLNHKIQALPLRDKIFTTMSNKSNAAWAFLAGAAVGATLGILYAPDKGKNTRDKLSFQLEKYRDKLKEYLDQLMNGKEVAFTPARSEGEKVVKDTRHQAETLLADVEQLMGQIKSRNNQ